MPRDKGVRDQWVESQVLAPPRMPFAAIILYGSSRSFKIEDGKTPPDKGKEKGQIPRERPQSSMRGSIKRAGIWPGDGGAGNGTPSPLPRQLKGTSHVADSRAQAPFA